MRPLLIVAILTALATPASAQFFSMSTPEPEGPVVERWYGWQLLIVDGVAAGATVALGAADQPVAAAVVGLIIWSSVTPMLHSANGNPNALLASFGLRLLGLSAVLITHAATGDDHDGDPMTPNEVDVVPVAISAGIAFVGIAVLDSFVLGFEKIPVTVAPTEGGAVIGISGRF